jgi:hypothetical protein
VDGGGNAVTATEVVAFADTWGGVDAYFVTPAGALQHVWFSATAAGSWTAPAAVSGAPTGLSGLRVAYTPGASNTAGSLVVYAATASGTLFLYFGSGGSWKGYTTTIDTSVRSWSLALKDNTCHWVLTGAQAYSTRGLVYAATGTISLSSFSQTSTAPMSGMPTGPVLATATNMSGTTDTMMLMLVDVVVGSAVQQQLGWVINPAGGGAFAYGALAGTNLTSAAVVESPDGFLNVYAIDTTYNLLVLHQVAYNAAQMSSGFTSAQTWGPVLQLDTGMAAVFSSAMPTDAPALLAVDGAEGALHLYFQDPNTTLWRVQPVRLPTTTQYTLTRWRTKAVVYDDQGLPAPGVALTVSASSAVDLEVNARSVVVTSDQSATVVTDRLGQVTCASLANSLATPSLTFSAATLPAATSHSPSAPINAWFAGVAPLPSQPAFSGATLAGASVDGQPVAPGAQGSAPTVDPDVAAQAIAQCAALAPGYTGTQPMSLKAAPGHSVHAYSLIAGRPVYQSFASRAHHTASFGVIGDVWDDVWDFAGDVWHGIEQGVTKVAEVVVDVAKGVVSLVVWIGDQLVQLADFVVTCVEDAMHAIVAVFQWIGAEVMKVIHWLEALFDFAAIWRTKEVFVQAMTDLPEFLVTQSAVWSAALQDGAIRDAKATVNAYFQRAIAACTDGQTFSSLTGFTPTGTPPSATQPVAGQCTQNDLTNNVQANWFTDQMMAYGPTTLDGLPVDTQAPIAGFFQAMADVAGDLEAMFTTFGKGLQAALGAGSVSNFADIAMATFLALVAEFIDSLLDIADALVQALLTAMSLTGKLFVALLTAELHIPVISDIYTWMSGLAGYPGEQLTLGNLIGLVTAFPVTVLYKLIEGVDTEPFPPGWNAGAAPTLSLAATSGGSVTDTIRRTLGVVGGLLTCLSTVWYLFTDFTGGETPTWVSIASIVTTGLHIACADPIYLDFGGMAWTATAITAANLAWILPCLYYTVGASVMASYNKLKDWCDHLFPGDVPGELSLAAVPGKFVFTDFMLVGLSLFGACELAYGCLAPLVFDYNGLEITIGIIEPLPSMLDFLVTTPVRMTPVVGEVALAAKVVVDVLACLSGGALEITNAVT